MLVEVGKELLFEEYVGEEGLVVCGWFDDDMLVNFDG